MWGYIGAFVLGAICGVVGVVIGSCLVVSSMESEAERKREHTPEDNG